MSSNYASLILSATPSGYYRLKETAGLTANDDSLLNNDGSYTGTYTLAQTSAVHDPADYSVNFNGGRVGQTSKILNFAYVTIEGWINLNSYPSTTALLAGCAEGYSGAEFDKDLYIDNTGKPNFYIYDSLGTVVKSTSPSAINLNEWYHIVGTWDGSVNRLYVNGVQRATANGTGASWTGYNFPEFYIGDGGNATYAGATDGKIDEVAIYNYALSSGVVYSHFIEGRTIHASITAYMMGILGSPSGGMNMYLKGPEYQPASGYFNGIVTGSIGSGVYQYNNFPLYMNVDPEHAYMNAYIHGTASFEPTSGYMNLYMEAGGIEVIAGFDAIVYGGAGGGGYPASSGFNLFIQGDGFADGYYPHSGSMNLYLQGGTGVENSINLYMPVHDVPTNNFPAYIYGVSGATSSSINNYMRGVDSISGVLNTFIRGYDDSPGGSDFTFDTLTLTDLESLTLSDLDLLEL